MTACPECGGGPVVMLGHRWNCLECECSAVALHVRPLAWARVPWVIREAAERVLTPRELAVLKLEASGAGIQQTGWRLGISSSTARTHRDRSWKKLRLALRPLVIDGVLVELEKAS